MQDKGFKLLGVRPLSNCNPQFSKSLVEGKLYAFYTDALLVEDKTIKPAGNLDFRLDSLIFNKSNSSELTISALVGENGSGKSTIIELNSNDFHHLPEMNRLLQENDLFKLMHKGGESTKYIKHFASRNYKLTQAELENLGETLFNFINRDFKPVMQIILKNNYPNLKISYLES